MKVLVIGAGNMGLTYAEGMAKSSLLNHRNLMIFDKSAEVITTLSKIDHFDVYDDIEECLPKADIVFIAVKPYHCDSLFEEIRHLVNDQQIFVSLMAGVTIYKIQEGLDVKKVVRSMPNLPAQVGKGVTSFTEAEEVSRVELLMVRNLLDTTGLSPSTWMESVASKGGTTRAALDSMDDNNVEELIKDAAYAAFDRAVELGKE